MPSIPELIDNLTSGNDDRAEQSARSFVPHGQHGLEALLDLARHPEADRRWWALRALACFPAEDYPQAGERLVEGLKDVDAAVRACAAVGLRERPAPEAVPALIDLLAHEDQLLARLAGDALAALEKQASPALIEYLGAQGDTHSIGKVEAVRALALIGDPASISALFQAWENGSIMVQHWAEQGLNDMGIGMAFFDPGG